MILQTAQYINSVHAMVVAIFNVVKCSFKDLLAGVLRRRRILNAQTTIVHSGEERAMGILNAKAVVPGQVLEQSEKADCLQALISPAVISNEDLFGEALVAY